MSGLVLVSPVLDFGWFSQPGHAPWVHVVRLPPSAAAAIEERGGAGRERLQEAERYASGEYLVDLMRGLQDKEAVERVSSPRGRTHRPRSHARPPTRRPHRRRHVPAGVSAQRGTVVSAYDARVQSRDPEPNANVSRFEDPALDGLTAPLTSAILDHLDQR